MQNMRALSINRSRLLFALAIALLLAAFPVLAQHNDETQDPARVVVYKKWVGMSGKAADVRIDLDCESGEYSGYRLINEGEPDGWEIRDVDPEGILCNVSEEVRENYRPDIIDCQGLYILPGHTEECTLVNTRVVKRIEMLNRYGKIVMILLIFGVGLMAVKRRS